MMAETAELAVRLKLEQAAYMRGMAQATAATNKFGTTAGAIGGHLKSGLGSALTNLTKIGLLAGAAVGAGLAVQVRAGFDSLTRLEEVTAQTNAVLRSTKGAAGESGAAILALSEKYEDLNATIDNKVIQSAENLLLTFTSIRKNAFEPALKAALDMNQAMGGGEGGLQGTIIQVGKALQDPIKGLTALRRVGVNFSEDQQKQIKDLIKHNKLYEAQKLILAELTKEFGGSFAAAGKTASGTFASLGDAIEDIQMNLTRALLPALTEVAKELTKVAKDPAFLRGVEDFGKGLAGAFKNAVTFAKQVPWKAIGDGLKTAAGAAGTLIKAFMDAPDWLKTAVITGWGLNKLTGGALAGIGGELLKSAGSQFLGRGSSPMMPLFVSQVGIGGAAGGGGLLGKAAAVAQGVFIVGIAAEAADLIHGIISPGGGLEGRASGQGGGMLPGDTLSWPFGPKNTPHLSLGPWKDILRGDSTFMGSAMPIGSILHPFTGGGTGATGGALGGAGIANSTTALRAFTAAAIAGARALEKDWIKNLAGIGARSKAAFGKEATPAQIAATRTRDELHQLKVITEKSRASNDSKLERLRVLAADAKAHGDTKTATKIQTAITRMKADIKAQEAKTTTAVAVGAAGIIGAIATHQSDMNVYVTTNVSANSITRTSTKVARYGNTGDDRRYDP